MSPNEKEALIDLLDAHAHRIITKLGGDSVHVPMFMLQGAQTRVNRAEEAFRAAGPEELIET